MVFVRRGVKARETMLRSRLCSGSSMARKEWEATMTTSGKSSMITPWVTVKSSWLRETSWQSSCLVSAQKPGLSGSGGTRVDS